MRSKAEAWKLALNNQGLIGEVLKSNFGWLELQNEKVVGYRDYYQSGFFGLYIAARRYQKSRGKFSTYAWKWIYQSVSRTFRTEGFNSVRVPCYAYDKLSKVKKKFKEEFESYMSNGVNKNLRYAYNALSDAIPLDAPLDADDAGSPTLGEISLASNPLDSILELLGNDKKEVISKALSTLEDRERLILEYRFGLNGRPAHELKKITHRFKLSRQRISQLEHIAIKKIRKYFIQNDIARKDLGS